MRRTHAWLVALVVAGSLVVPVSAAQAAGVRYVDQIFEEVEVTENIPYGQAVNSQGDLQTLLLDLYEPAGDEEPARGLYVWVHGGNFNSGNKSSIGPILDYVRRGWVAASISYRVRPELPGGAAIGVITNPDYLQQFIDAVKDAQHDAQAAVRFARQNAGDWRIDPDQIAIGGISAGGITALAVAFNPDDPGASGTPDQSSVVSAAVSHAGAYAPVLEGRMPLPGDPAIGIYHGVLDEQVPYPVAPLGCLLTLAVGNACEFVTFPGDRHSILGANLARDFLYRHVILGRDETRVPLVTNLDGDPIEVLAGIEPAGVDAGVTAGVVQPTDPAHTVGNAEYLVNYVLNGLGVPSPL